MKIEDITYSKNNTHIPNSYEVINKQLMEEYIKWIIEERIIRKYPITRTLKSYQREWLGHNRLYRYFTKRKEKEKNKKKLKKIESYIDRAKDADLNENNSVIEELIWLIIGR